MQHQRHILLAGIALFALALTGCGKKEVVTSTLELTLPDGVVETHALKNAFSDEAVVSEICAHIRPHLGQVTEAKPLEFKLKWSQSNDPKMAKMLPETNHAQVTFSTTITGSGGLIGSPAGKLFRAKRSESGIFQPDGEAMEPENMMVVAVEERVRSMENTIDASRRSTQNNLDRVESANRSQAN